ncbi:MAG: hypothetical protein AAF690_08460 [Acidobacteriota bacterium]
MKPNTEEPTSSELIAWGLRVLEDRVTVKSLALTQEARDEFVAFVAGPAATAAEHPRYFRRYWQNVHRLIRDVGTLSASSAEWARRTEVLATDVEAALTAYRHIKTAATVLCDWWPEENEQPQAEVA